MWSQFPAYYSLGALVTDTVASGFTIWLRVCGCPLWWVAINQALMTLLSSSRKEEESLSGGIVLNLLAASTILFLSPSLLFLCYLYRWICNGGAVLGGPRVIIFHSQSLSNQSESAVFAIGMQFNFISAFLKQLRLPYILDQELQKKPTLIIIGLPLIFFLIFLLKEFIVSMNLCVVHKELACQIIFKKTTNKITLI